MTNKNEGLQWKGMDTVWEELLGEGVFHCALCRELLTTPVWVKSDGTNVCNSCYELEGECLDGVVKNSALTTIVERLHFPCRYHDKGCKQVLPYSHYQRHVRECVYAQTCLFPLCNWGGTRSTLMMHLCDKHSDVVLREKDGAFSVRLNKGIIGKINVVRTQSGRFITSITRTLEKLDLVIYNFDNVKSSKVGCFILQYSSGPKMTTQHEAQVCDNISALTTMDRKMATEITLPAELNISLFKLIYQPYDKRPVIHKELIPFLSCTVCQNYFTSEELELVYRLCKKCLQCQKNCYNCGRNVFSHYRTVTNNKYICGTCINNPSLYGHQSTATTIKVKPNNISSNLLRHFLFPCRFEALGCKFKGPASGEHEVNCDYRSVDCPVADCTHQSRYPQLLLHMMERHADICVNDNTRQFSLNFKTHNSMLFFLIYCNKLIRHQFVKTSTNKQQTIFSGPVSQIECEYKWQVDLPVDGKADFVFTVRLEASEPAKMLNMTYNCGQTLMLHPNAIHDFVKENVLLYHLEVTENNRFMCR